MMTHIDPVNPTGYENFKYLQMPEDGRYLFFFTKINIAISP